MASKIGARLQDCGPILLTLADEAAPLPSRAEVQPAVSRPPRVGPMTIGLLLAAIATVGLAAGVVCRDAFGNRSLRSAVTDILTPLPATTSEDRGSEPCQ
jgi:hypothetical protein